MTDLESSGKGTDMRPLLGFPMALLIIASVVPACVGKSSLGDYEDGGDADGDGDGDGSTSEPDDGGTSTSSADGGVDTGDNPQACGLAPEPGPCNAAFTRYYFDPDEGTCKTFTYGGCDGVVPFETLAECEASCLACDVFDEPDDATVAIDIVFVNQTAQTLFVDGFGGAGEDCDGGYPFRITAATSHFNVYLDLVKSCQQPCASAGTTCELPSCPPVCHIPPVIRVDPGGSYTMPWAAMAWAHTSLPESCAQCDVEDPYLECIRPDPFVFGAEYLFQSVAGELVCFGNGPCEGCQPGPDGSCLVEFGGEVDPLTSAGTLVTWDGSAVTITFE